MTRACALASTSMATVLSAAIPERAKLSAVADAHPLVAAAKRLEHGHARGAEADLSEEARERRRPLAVRGERENAGAVMEMRADAGELAPMQRDERRLRQRPAEPRRRQAEG